MKRATPGFRAFGRLRAAKLLSTHPAIAHTGFGQDQSRGCRVGFDLLAQLADEDAEVLDVFLVRGAPDRC
jgi:hypothetical protein